MSNWKDYCNRCVLDAVDKGKLDEEVLYHSDGRKKILKDYGPAYPVYENHGIFVFYACSEKCENEQKEKYDPVIFEDYKEYENKAQQNGERFEPDY